MNNLQNKEIEMIKCQAFSLNTLHVFVILIQQPYKIGTIIIFIFMRWGNWGTEGLRNLPVVMHLVLYVFLKEFQWLFKKM